MNSFLLTDSVDFNLFKDEELKTTTNYFKYYEVISTVWGKCRKAHFGVL